MMKDHIDARGFAAILAFTILWGLNYAAIKFSNTGLSPIFTTFLYQLVFSIPIISLCAYFFEDQWVRSFSCPAFLSPACQSVIVAFIPYFIWFLIHVYPVSKLSAFTFLTLIFGVFSGVFFMKEELTFGLVSGLILVCGGIYCANYRK